MTKKKKVNPRKKPVTQADLNKAKNAAISEAIEMTWAIFFNVLRDKEGYTTEDLQRVWGEVNNLSDSIVQGYVNVADLKYILKQEEGVVFQ